VKFTVTFMDWVVPVVDETIRALAGVRFVEDPIAGVRYSRATSIVSSAYKRHGRILGRPRRSPLILFLNPALRLQGLLSQQIGDPVPRCGCFEIGCSHVGVFGLPCIRFGFGRLGSVKLDPEPQTNHAWNNAAVAGFVSLKAFKTGLGRQRLAEESKTLARADTRFPYTTIPGRSASFDSRVRGCRRLCSLQNCLPVQLRPSA